MSVLADNPRLTAEVMSRAKGLEGWCAELLADMIRAASVSGDEARVADLMEEALGVVPGISVRRDGLGSVVALLGAGGTRLAMDGHLDTVAVGRRDLWQGDPRGGVVEDGFVRGRGACDQLGGVAAMVGAAQLLGELAVDLPCELILVGSVMEEDCEGLAWEHLLKEEGIAPDAVLLTEPTGLAVHRGHRGRVEIEVSVPGKSSHGSQPHLGVNAAYGASEIALEVARLNERLAEQPVLGKGTVAVTELRTQAPSLCAVPDRAGLHLDRRLTVGETPERAAEEVRALSAVGKWKAEVTIPDYSGAGYTGKVYPIAKSYPTWVLPDGHPFLELAGNVYGQFFGGSPQVSVWRFSTNGVSTMGRHGIPSVGFGPGFEKEAHAPDETCPVDHLWRAMAFYAGLALSFPGGLLPGWKNPTPRTSKCELQIARCTSGGTRGLLPRE